MAESCRPVAAIENATVDQVWERLKAATCQPSMDKLVGKVLTSSGNKQNKPSLPIRGLSAAILGVDDKLDAVNLATNAWDDSKATHFDSGDLERACRPYLQKLTSDVVSVRQVGMASIQKLIDCPHVSSDNMADALSTWLGKALVKSMADTVQSIRMTAVSMFRGLIQKHPDAVLPMLPYSIPVLEGRLYVDEHGDRQEQTEEIRLELLKTVSAMVEHSGSALAAYMAEVLCLLRACLSDPFHEVVIPTCNCMAVLARQLRRRLQPVSKQLVADVLPLTTHRRKAVRCAAVRAVRQFMFCGAHEMILDMVAWRDPNSVAIKAFYEPDPKVNFCGKLSTDDAAAVRLEFISAAGDWLLHLDERIDHQGRLLPYLVTGLTDTHPEVQQRSLSLLEEIGALYEKDNEKDLKDILTYLPEEAHNIGWRSVGDAWQGGHASGFFPSVFKERPHVGTRRVVASNFGGVVGGIAGELRGWDAECRCRAAALLEMYCVLVEDWMQQKVFELLPAMLQAAAPAYQRAADADALSTAAALGRCFCMMGLFVPLEAFMRMVEPVLVGTELPAGLRAAAVAAVRDFLDGAWHRGGGDECVRAAVRIILDEGLSETQSSVLKRGLISLTSTFICCAGGPLLQEMQGDILNLLLRLQAWPASNEGARQEIGDLVEAEIERLHSKVTVGNPLVTSLDEMLAHHQEELLRRWHVQSSKLQQDITDAATLRLQAAARASMRHELL